MCLAVRTRAGDGGAWVRARDKESEWAPGARSPEEGEWSSITVIGSNAGEVSACGLESSGTRQRAPYQAQVLSSLSFWDLSKAELSVEGCPSAWGVSSAVDGDLGGGRRREEGPGQVPTGAPHRPPSTSPLSVVTHTDESTGRAMNQPGTVCLVLKVWATAIQGILTLERVGHEWAGVELR